MTLFSTGLEVLDPEGEIILPGYRTMIPFNWKTATWLLWSAQASESIGKEGGYGASCGE